MGPPHPLPLKAHHNPQIWHNRHSITVTQQEGRSETVLLTSGNRIGWLGFPSFWCILVETVHPPPTGWGSAGKWSNKLWSRNITPPDRETSDKGPAIHRPWSSRLFLWLKCQRCVSGEAVLAESGSKFKFGFPELPQSSLPWCIHPNLRRNIIFPLRFFCETQNRRTIEMSL